ncbi:MAG TPA: hypothetical protein VJT31_10325 [Rugosimonospora sp.]|nr:hypothetical protein [Rugosimonospora sp.]
MLLSTTGGRYGQHRGVRRGRPQPPHRRARQPRVPLLGLPALVLFGLLAAFFAWVTAEPLWLSVGHATPGTATVIHCSGHGLDQRCRATFQAAGAAFTADRVDLIGAQAQPLTDGAQVRARMVSRGGRLAYAGDSAGLVLRWALGAGLTLICGVAIALLTGAHRLPDRRSRWYAVLASVGGPILLMLGMLAVTR